MGILQAIFLFLRAFILGRAAAAFENLALRQQVAVLKQSVKRPKLQPRDRLSKSPAYVLHTDAGASGSGGSLCRLSSQLPTSPADVSAAPLTTPIDYFRPFLRHEVEDRRMQLSERQGPDCVE